MSCEIWVTIEYILHSYGTVAFKDGVFTYHSYFVLVFNKEFKVLVVTFTDGIYTYIKLISIYVNMFDEQEIGSSFSYGCTSS